jgi:hypothetical protein
MPHNENSEVSCLAGRASIETRCTADEGRRLNSGLCRGPEPGLTLTRGERSKKPPLPPFMLLLCPFVP